MKRIFVVLVAVAVLGQAGAANAAVEYVKVCSSQGAGWFYNPGTMTCVNTNTGKTRTFDTNGNLVSTGVTQSEQDSLNAQEGAAIGLALPGTTVDPGKHFGVSAHVGTFNGMEAVGVGGAFRLNDDVTFDGGAAIGTTYGTVGGRAGVNVSW